MQLSGWGNHPRIPCQIDAFGIQAEAHRLITEGKPPFIARGLGRSYGDSSLMDRVISTERFNRIIAFDDTTGEVICESGVSFEDLINAFLPRGWFPPVTPGTKFVTMGGAVASDVHSKNHHVDGTFGDQVSAMDIMLADGSVVTCSREENSELFHATIGGMGLTGLVLRVTLPLRRVETAYIRQETLAADNLNAIMDLFEASTDWTYSVAWIDCLAQGDIQGRSILMRGEHALGSDLIQAKHLKQRLRLHTPGRLNVPFNLPGWLLNRHTVTAFNTLYHGRAKMRPGRNIVHYDPFFYPLDAIHNWNRIYGRRGFTQYQCVLPTESSREGLSALLSRIATSGLASFLAVLKLFGEHDNMLSFPRKGYTLALDFPINDGLFAVLDELDRIVIDHGGRLYLTKDVRMKREMFDATYENAEAFRALRKRFDPDKRFQSLQSQRLGF